MIVAANGRYSYWAFPHMYTKANERYSTGMLQHLYITAADGRYHYRTLQHMDKSAIERYRNRALQHIGTTANFLSVKLFYQFYFFQFVPSIINARRPLYK